MQPSPISKRMNEIRRIMHALDSHKAQAFDLLTFLPERLADASLYTTGAFVQPTDQTRFNKLMRNIESIETELNIEVG